MHTLVSMRGATTLTLNMSIIMRGFTAVSPVRFAVPPLLMRQPRPSEEVMGCRSRIQEVHFKVTNLILHQKLKYYKCCLRDVTLKIERDLSNSIRNDVKFSWTAL